MLYLLAVPLVLVSAGLLVVGGRGPRPLALHAAEAIWLPGVVVACLLTWSAWQGRAASESWDAFGVPLFVWPYSALIGGLGLAELLLLRGRRDRQARISRAVVSGYLVVLGGCTIVGAICL